MQVSRKVKMIVGGVVLLPIFLFLIYTWIALTYSLSLSLQNGSLSEGLK